MFSLQASGGKLASRFLSSADVDDMELHGGSCANKRRRAGRAGELDGAAPRRRGALQPTIPALFRPAVCHTSEGRSNIFEGLVFHVSTALEFDESDLQTIQEIESLQGSLHKPVLNTDDVSQVKEFLERQIQENGGEIEQNPSAGSFAVADRDRSNPQHDRNGAVRRSQNEVAAPLLEGPQNIRPFQTRRSPLREARNTVDAGKTLRSVTYY